jgi:hypothetical protein
MKSLNMFANNIIKAVLFLLFSVVLFSCSGRPSLTQEELDSYPWYKEYSQNHLPEAEGLLEQKISDTSHPDLIRFQMEIKERLKKYGEAEKLALQLLDEDDEDGAAWVTRFNIRYPVFGGKPFPGEDSTLYLKFLNNAFERDPKNRVAAEMRWILGKREARPDWCEAALNRLWEINAYTPLIQYISKWMLVSLPPDALFFSNGDMDTFSPLVVQQGEGIRSDVLIFNTSLLADYQYFRRSVFRLSLLPYKEKFVHKKLQKGIHPSLTALTWLTEKKMSGEVEQPICFSPFINRPQLEKVALNALDFGFYIVNQGNHYCLEEHEFSEELMRYRAGEDVEGKLNVVFDELQKNNGIQRDFKTSLINLTMLSPEILGSEELTRSQQSPVLRSANGWLATGLILRAGSLASQIVKSSELGEDEQRLYLEKLRQWLDGFEGKLTAKPDAQKALEQQKEFLGMLLGIQ